MPSVSPIVPDAQKNQGPALFLEALRGGLAFMSQVAQQRRQSETEVARMAFAERQAEEAHALDKRKLDMAAEMIPYQQNLMESQAEFASERAKAYADGTATAAQRVMAANKQRELLLNEVNKSASELKLDDPNFATKEPVKFAANVLQFEDMYRFSPAPEVKNAIRQYRTIADQQKISLKTGAFDEESQSIKGSGTGRLVPIWQVVKRMMDPLTQEQTLLDLQASGHTRVVDGFTDMTDKSGNKIQVPTKTTEPTPLIKSYLEKGKGVDFTPVPSRVAPATSLKSAEPMIEPTQPLGPVDLPEVTDDPLPYQPTETDTMLQNAQAAIKRGAPIKAVAERLQSLGIDPNQLWAT